MQVNVHNLLAALSRPAMLVSHDGRIAAMNSPAAYLFSDSAIGRSFGVVLRQPTLLRAVERVRLEKVPLRADARLRGRETGDALYSVEVSPMTIDGGTGVLLIFEDLSEKETTNRMRQDFVADVSHELKTPLTAIGGFLETLNGPAREDDAMHSRFLGLMSDEVGRMARLVDDLLTLSRVESRSGPMKAAAVDLGEIARATRDFLADLAGSANVSLAIGEMLPEAVVSGDPDQIRRVARNLVGNALAHADANAVTISVVSVPRDGILRTPAFCLRVEDDGRGIEARHLPRLTERFYRVDSHRARNGVGGTGLGLSIVKHILLKHRGRLAVSSVPGQGARFDAIFPAAAEDTKL